MAIPREIEGQKYISLTTFRKNGVAVSTPVWFGEDGGKLYVMSNHDAGKCKRIRNNPKVKVAPCTIRERLPGRNLRRRRGFCLPKKVHEDALPSAENIGWRGCHGGGKATCIWKLKRRGEVVRIKGFLI